MVRALMAAAIALSGALASSAPAAAHLGGTAYVLVPADFILPGQPFEVVAADMGADADVELEIVNVPTVAALGSVRAAADGHFVTSLTLPADFPVGYAQLFASVADGTRVSTWVLVGERTSETPAAPNAGNLLSDPSVLVLLVFLVGAVCVLGYLLFRSRGKPGTAPVPAEQTRRRSVRSKYRRRI